MLPAQIAAFDSITLAAFSSDLFRRRPATNKQIAFLDRCRAQLRIIHLDPSGDKIRSHIKRNRVIHGGFWVLRGVFEDFRHARTENEQGFI